MKKTSNRPICNRLVRELRLTCFSTGGRTFAAQVFDLTKEKAGRQIGSASAKTQKGALAAALASAMEGK